MSAPGSAGPLGPWRPAHGPRTLASFIDHTLLKAEATRADIVRLCAEARCHRFAAACVNPAWVPLVAEELKGSGVAVAAVCGFPLGASSPRAKAHEAAVAVEQGASEIDMVAAVGLMKGGEWDAVAADIRAVVSAVPEALVKVILETAVLTPEEIVAGCRASRDAGAHYVKTSTGFHAKGGATVEAVTLMRRTVGEGIGVKASGGVRDCVSALRMLAAGASRIGTSSGVALVECLGPGPLPLTDLLADPARHAAACRTVPRG